MIEELPPPAPRWDGLTHIGWMRAGAAHPWYVVYEAEGQHHTIRAPVNARPARGVSRHTGREYIASHTVRGWDVVWASTCPRRVRA